jgi:hypothetical protein
MIGLTLPPNAGRVALPVVTIVGAVVAGVWLGVEIALLIVAAGALTGVIALLWASVQALTGESPLTLDEALTLGAPSGEEEQKRAVLRALKDLEFERSVGKITEEDYTELSTRYRNDAKRLIQLIDAGSELERDRAEKALQARLEKAPPPAPKPKSKSKADDAEASDAEASDAETSDAEASDATRAATDTAEPSSPSPSATSTSAERKEEAT